MNRIFNGIRKKKTIHVGMLFYNQLKYKVHFLSSDLRGKKLCNVIKVLRGIGIIQWNAGKNLIEPLTKKSLRAMFSEKEEG